MQLKDVARKKFKNTRFSKHDGHTEWVRQGQCTCSGAQARSARECVVLPDYARFIKKTVEVKFSGIIHDAMM